MKTFWLCFVPLFVAVDAVGLLPMFLTMTQAFSPIQRRRVVVQSVITAMVVAVGFLFFGQWLLRMLGVTIADFMIAGGSMLFVLSMADLFLTPKGEIQVDPQSIGAVPIGVPLTVGPAVLATIVLLADQYGPGTTVLAIVANIGLAGVVFLFAGAIHRVLGSTGTRAISKIMVLILAAIAVKMVREGVVMLIRQWT